MFMVKSYRIYEVNGILKQYTIEESGHFNVFVSINVGETINSKCSRSQVLYEKVKLKYLAKLTEKGLHHSCISVNLQAYSKAS